MISAQQKKTIRRIEIYTVIIYIVSLIASGCFTTRTVILGVAFGGAVSIINFDLIRRIIEKVLGDPALIRGYYFIFIILKFGLLLALIGFLLRLNQFRPEAFAAGFSVILIGIILEAILTGLGITRYDLTENENSDSKPRYYAESSPEKNDKEKMLR